MPEDTLTWVVGARGLLGSAVVRELERDGRAHRVAQVPWSDPDAAVAALVAGAEEVLGAGRPWRILWCAGAGVIGTGEDELRTEVGTLERFLDALAGRLASGSAPGALFLASSAGGVYAGSGQPPFTEDTPARAISPYGEAKLAAEEAVRGFAARSGVPVLIGRIANLYGPGQDVTKAQGLVSQLCKAHLARRPLSIYVSLDTARDYLYVDDAARLTLAGTERVAAGPSGEVVVKILASQRGTTVAAILGELRRITRRRPQVVLGASPLAKFQIRDLRFRSTVWPDLDRLVTTSLPAGVAATLGGLGLDMRRGDAAPGRAS